MEMRKGLLIISGIIILLLLVSIAFKSTPEPLTDPNGKSYISLSKKEAVLNYQSADVFVLKNPEDKISIYQIIGYPSDGVSYQSHQLESPDSFTDDSWKDGDFKTIAAALFDLGYLENLNKENVRLDTLNDLNYAKRKELFVKATEFQGRRYLSKADAANDWFSRIDDSVIIFILLSFIPFLILLFQDLILFLTKAQAFSKQYYGVQAVMLLLTVLFFFNMVTPETYAASNLTAFIKYMLLFFSIYFIYQYLIKDILKDEQAYKKAIILFAIAIVCSVVTTLLARLLDQYVFGSDSYTMLAQRPIYFELGFLFSFVLGNFFNNLRRSYFKHRSRSKELESTQDKVLASEAELNAIQASVNPHFLYNSLNAIASLAKSDPDKTEAMALALSKFYKYQTNRKSEPLSSLNEELEMIENYITIEKIRFGDRLQYKMDIDEKSKLRKIPHFMLQPLLENAVKYGFNEESEKIDILLSIKSNDKDLFIQLYDTGKEFSENLDSGYGLKSVIKKLQLFYPNSHSIDFINTPKKHVAITIQNA